MGLKAGLQILQQTGKVVANYADDAARLATQSCDDIAKYAKACGKRSILETKPSIFHGINPTISYPPSGKVYELPRFCTQEMQQARKLNQIALRQIKQPISSSFPKATAEDLKRLTSETVEDSFSRVQWTNPKDGKVYNLLKQSETADGKCLIRILDQEGAFVKEATITPKRIVMIDAKTECYPFNLKDASHCDVVYTYLRRNNPFAKINGFNVTGEGVIFEMGSYVGEKTNIVDSNKLIRAFQYLTKEIKNGNIPDYITVSIGNEFNPQKGLKTGKLELEVLKAFQELCSTAKGKTRILFSAGNDGKHMLNAYLTTDVAEGVGALSYTGKLTGFSASRNSRYTQHYEQGVFQIKKTKYGLNVTGQPGTDILFYKGTKEELLVRKDYLTTQKTVIVKKLRKCDRLKSIDSREHFWRHLDRLHEISTKYNKDLRDIESEIASIEKTLKIINEEVSGTSFSTPVRTAKLALNDMMEGIL